MQANRMDVGAFRNDGADGVKSGPAFLTRIGVFTYVYPDGSVVRELRHPADVFDSQSLATLKAAPLVVSHPGQITADNWKQHAIGHVGDNVHAEGIYVAADVHVQDATAVADLGTSSVELSCGYSCVVIPEQGTFDGIEYDARQTSIRYNHVGVGPEGWGRAGPNVRMYFDSNESNPVHCAQGCYGEEMKKFLPVNRADGANAPTPPNPAPVAPASGGSGRVDGVSREDFDAVRGELAAANAKIAQLEASKNDAAQRSAIRVRMDLLKVAEAQGLDTERADNMTDDQIRCAVLAKVRPDVKTDGESSEYIRAAFDFARKSDANAKQAAAGETPPANETRKDGPIGSKVEKARLDGIEKAKNAWKGGN